MTGLTALSLMGHNALSDTSRSISARFVERTKTEKSHCKRWTTSTTAFDAVTGREDLSSHVRTLFDFLSMSISSRFFFPMARADSAVTGFTLAHHEKRIFSLVLVFLTLREWDLLIEDCAVKESHWLFSRRLFVSSNSVKRYVNTREKRNRMLDIQFLHHFDSLSLVHSNVTLLCYASLKHWWIYSVNSVNWFVAVYIINKITLNNRLSTMLWRFSDLLWKISIDSRKWYRPQKPRCILIQCGKEENSLWILYVYICIREPSMEKEKKNLYSGATGLTVIF